MDISTSMTATQMILIWTLLGFLLIWMITFAVLAFQPNPKNQVKQPDIPAPSDSFPASSAPLMPHVTASQPVQMGSVTNDAARDIGTVPVT